jgi:hypothetical protein
MVEYSDMADEPDQDNSFQSRASTVIQDTAEAAAAALAALASGLVLRAQEILALADEAGHVVIPVHGSSCIAELSYDTVTGTMGVVFLDGAEYDYPSVSMRSFLAFVNAFSKGRHYNEHFRDSSPSQFLGSHKQRIRIGRR